MKGMQQLRDKDEGMEARKLLEDMQSYAKKCEEGNRDDDGKMVDEMTTRMQGDAVDRALHPKSPCETRKAPPTPPGVAVARSQHPKSPCETRKAPRTPLCMRDNTMKKAWPQNDGNLTDVLTNQDETMTADDERSMGSRPHPKQKLVQEGIHPHPGPKGQRNQAIEVESSDDEAAPKPRGLMKEPPEKQRRIDEEMARKSKQEKRKRREPDKQEAEESEKPVRKDEEDHRTKDARKEAVGSDVQNTTEAMKRWLSFQRIQNEADTASASGDQRKNQPHELGDLSGEDFDFEDSRTLWTAQDVGDEGGVVRTQNEKAQRGHEEPNATESGQLESPTEQRSEEQGHTATHPVGRVQVQGALKSQ